MNSWWNELHVHWNKNMQFRLKQHRSPSNGTPCIHTSAASTYIFCNSTFDTPPIVSRRKTGINIIVLSFSFTRTDAAIPNFALQCVSSRPQIIISLYEMVDLWCSYANINAASSQWSVDCSANVNIIFTWETYLGGQSPPRKIRSLSELRVSLSRPEKIPLSRAYVRSTFTGSHSIVCHVILWRCYELTDMYNGKSARWLSAESAIADNTVFSSYATFKR